MKLNDGTEETLTSLIVDDIITEGPDTGVTSELVLAV